MCVVQGSTPSANTGPSVDHTTGTGAGHYVYVEATMVPVGAKAHLASDVYKRSADTCALSFFYHMYGQHMGTLSLLLKVSVPHVRSTYGHPQPAPQGK